MKDLLKEENQKYNEYDDCGCLLYDVTQNVYQGGSGPVCNGLVSFGYIYQMMLKGKYQRVLVLATGALLNPVIKNYRFLVFVMAMYWRLSNELRLILFVLWVCLCCCSTNL